MLKPIYNVTPEPRYPFGTLTLEGLAAAFVSHTEARRDALLRELVGLERDLGYGQEGKPTTSRLRKLWRQWCGRCPHCGRGLE